MMTIDLFEMYMKKLMKDYGDCILINLVSQVKKEENCLSVFFLKLLENAQKRSDKLKSGIQYVSYDFHKETTGDKFYKISELMTLVSGLQKKFKYFHIEKQPDCKSNIKKV